MFLPSSLGGPESTPLYFAHISRFFKLSVRDQEHAFQILQNIIFGSDKKDIHFFLIMFLICLKHKHIDEYKEQIILKDSERLNKYFGMEGAKFDNFYVFGRHYPASGQIVNDKFLIGSLFEYYFSLLDGSLENKNLKEEIGFEWQINISRALIGPVPKNWRTGVYEGEHDLGSYFRLLDQSGRLVANP